MRADNPGSLSYGQNRTVAADHWPQWDKARFADNVSQFMLEYLNTAFTPEECAKCALGQPADLDAAQYTIDGRDSDSESDSDSEDSDSESASDSDSESDDSAASDDDRPRKKRKISSKGEESQRGESKVSLPRRRSLPAPARAPFGSHRRARAQLQPRLLAEIHPRRRSKFLPRPPRCHPRLVPLDLHQPSLCPPRCFPHLNSLLKRLLLPNLRLICPNGWFLPEKERLQNVARNKLMFQQLKENFAPTEEPLREELRGLMKKARGGGRGGRRAAQASAGPARRSSRHTQHAQPAGREVDSGGVDDSLERIGSNMDGSPHGGEERGEGGDGGDAAASLSSSRTEGNDGASAGGAPPLSQAAQAAIGPQERMPPTSQLPPSTTFLPCPPHAPKWFCDAFALMTAEELGCHYSALIAAWTRMEEASRFEQGPTRHSTNSAARGCPKKAIFDGGQNLGDHLFWSGKGSL
ncbi:hypothetical protein R3P38DRAFT_3196338 [Favolaschia claudopus]|uniref:Uncharacterized protein n=1 Tax=Favolaschia claudopus TaxID=2862362 RepID=A0AAW0B7I0_9AGAR